MTIAFEDKTADIAVHHGDFFASLGDVRDIRPDHVITDPPYSPETHAGARSANSLDTSIITYASMTPEDILRAFTMANPRRWVVATVDYHAMPRLEAGPLYTDPPYRLRFIRHGVWVKPDGAPQFTGDRPGMGWEAVAIMHSTETAPEWNAGGTRAVWREWYGGDDLDATWTHGIERRIKYPGAKPIGLVKKWIEQFTDPGDLILDPFMGSGTVLLAARDLGRRAIGFDIDAAAVALTVQRLTSAPGISDRQEGLL